MRHQTREKVWSGQCGTSGWTAFPCFTTLGPTFRGRCPFRQYIPSKLAKYRIKIWAACDDASSYVWNLQVYTGKCKCIRGSQLEDPLKRTKGCGLSWTWHRDSMSTTSHAITFFTLHMLQQELLLEEAEDGRNRTKNKPELPLQFL
jgi:hypothetical protein